MLGAVWEGVSGGPPRPSVAGPYIHSQADRWVAHRGWCAPLRPSVRRLCYRRLCHAVAPPPLASHCRTRLAPAPAICSIISMLPPSAAVLRLPAVPSCASLPPSAVATPPPPVRPPLRPPASRAAASSLAPAPSYPPPPQCPQPLLFSTRVVPVPVASAAAALRYSHDGSLQLRLFGCPCLPRYSRVV